MSITDDFVKVKKEGEKGRRKGKIGWNELTVTRRKTTEKDNLRGSQREMVSILTNSNNTRLCPDHIKVNK